MPFLPRRIVKGDARARVSLILLAALLGGQIGLPNFSTPRTAPEAETAEACACGWWAKTWGVCCCRAKKVRACCAGRPSAKSVVKSCCASRPAKRAAQEFEPQATLTSAGNCHCQSDSATSSWLTSHDPQLVVRPLVWSAHVVRLGTVAIDSDRPREMTAAPAVPPPRSNSALRVAV